MTLSDEVLMSYADGQLNAGDRSQVRKLIAKDPALSERLAVFQTTGHGLASVFDEHLNSPLPDKLIRIVERAHPRPAQRAGRSQFADMLRNLLHPVQPFGLAAASAAVLIAGIGAGALIMQAGNGGGDTQLAGLIQKNGAVARGPLQFALDSLQSGKETLTALPEGKVMRMAVKLSFQDRAQDYCRQYEIGLSASQSYGGVACNTNGQWNIRFQTALAPAQQSTDKGAPAGHKAREGFEAAVISMIDGDALGPEEESAMIAGGWKKR